MGMAHGIKESVRRKLKNDFAYYNLYTKLNKFKLNLRLFVILFHVVCCRCHFAFMSHFLFV